MTLRFLSSLAAIIPVFAFAEPGAPESLASSSPGTITPSSVEGAEDEGTRAFLRAAAESAGPIEANHLLAPVDDLPDAAKFPLLSFAFERCGELKGDTDLASRAFIRLAARLREMGHYDAALTVVRNIPGPRQLVAALDLALEIDLADPDHGRDRAREILEEIVAAPSLTMSYREGGEVQLRQAQWAARKGDELELEEITTSLHALPTLEYLAQAEARIGTERCRRGLPYDINALVSEDVRAALLGRSVPDFMNGIGDALLEIALIEYDRAPEGSKRLLTEGLFERAVATAATSRAFAGEVLINACDALVRRGEAEMARQLFLRHAPMVSNLPDAVAVKPMVLARLAPLYRKWSDGFNAEAILGEARAIAERQHPLDQAISFIAMGGAWSALDENECALENWSMALEQMVAVPGIRSRNMALSDFAIEVSRYHGDWPPGFGDRVERIAAQP